MVGDPPAAGAMGVSRTEREPLRVLVVGRSELMLSGDAQESSPELSRHLRTARAGSLGRAYAVLASAARPIDAVLMEARLPDGEACDAVERVRALAPEAALLVVTNGEHDEELARWTIKRGAHGWLPATAAASPELVCGIVLQASHTRRLASSLRARTARFRRIIQATGEGMLVVNSSGQVVFCNPAAEKLFRKPARELRSEPFGVPLVAGESVELDLPHGRVAEMRVGPIEWEGAGAHLVTLRDVTERHRHAEELQALTQKLAASRDELEKSNAALSRAAFLDPLTGLLNRRGLERALASELSRTSRSGAPAVAMLIDCDNFKPVNETLGHAVGDVVLATIANRLEQSMRPSDHVARVGGDEFLVLLPETRLAEGLGLAERVRLAIAGSPLILAPGYVNVTASFGVALVPPDTTSIEEVLVLTRVALQRSKLGGKNRVASNDGVDPLQRGTLSATLSSAGAFEAVSHPIIDLRSGHSVGVELLSRGPQGAYRSPDEFLRVAVEERILTLVDLTCLKTCLVASADMASDRYHVNLMPSTILDTPSERLLELFPRHATARYCIEISEQQLIGDPQRLRDHLAPLREHGLSIAIDDVGFGRSCLESLVVLEPEIVKIDRSCVGGVAEHPGKRRQLSRLIGVTRALDTEVVAEGIECIEDLAVLRELGVDLGQGFLWGAPG